MKKSILFLAAILVTTTDSFIIKNVAHRLTPTDLKATYDADGKHLTYNPFQDSQTMDLDRAKECAENFGKCSTSEMEALRAKLHKERLQSFIFGGSQDALENFIIEEELELQLALLQDQTGNESTLFPAEIDSSIPHLNDPLSHEPNPVNVNKNESVLHAPTPMQVLALEESLLEENTMETILICLIAAAFIFMPQILT